MPLSLVLALEVASLAGTAVWLDGTPNPSLIPGSAAITAETAAAGAPWTQADERAIAFLAEELAAVRPMADVFDGELQIMVRLGAALADVRAVRPEDRDLLFSAMAFQGFAIHRYFQDNLATDLAAAPYRVEIQGRVEIGPWVDAIALNQERLPTLADVGDQSALLVFQELRARHLLTPTATVDVPNLPTGGRLVVDGRESAVDRARVLPGTHRLAITVDGRIESRVVRILNPGEQVSLIVPANPDALRALGTELSRGSEAVKLSVAHLEALSRLEAPLTLVVPTKRDPLVYDVDASVARLRVTQDETPRLVARGSVGGGWLYDGEFLLQNYDEGAPETRATVNAFTPWLGLGLELRPTAWLAAGAGLDLGLPLGEHHTVPVAEDALRLRAFPHLAVGHPYAQLTAGLLLPWRLGLGPRVHVPLGDVLELQGAYLYGIGLTRPRDEGEAAFEPTDVQTAWLGIGARLGR